MLLRYENEWPWGTDITLVYDNALGMISVSREEGDSFGFIHDLMVYPTARKQGRAGCLLRSAEKEILDHYKRPYAVLRVVPGSWMEAWYRRNGYVDFEDCPFDPVEGYIELIKKLK